MSEEVIKPLNLDWFADLYAERLYHTVVSIEQTGRYQFQITWRCWYISNRFEYDIEYDLYFYQTVELTRLGDWVESYGSRFQHALGCQAFYARPRPLVRKG